MNILLVEEDHSIVEPIVDALTSWDYRTEWSVTGADALERVRKRYFDLIIMDLFLPDLHGYELIPQLKKIQPDTGIVTITNINSRELELQARKQGIIYYMVKPLNIRIIKEILEHMAMDRFSKSPIQGQLS